MKKFALLAHPTKYSLSPKMWNAAFKSMGSDNTYGTADVSAEELIPQFPALKAEFSGFSVSMPHKETIIPLLDQISPEAAAIKAVNTVKIDGEKAYGFNTDWIGVTQALEVIPKLPSKQVLINGAGGATRAAIYALNKLHIIPHVYARNTEKLSLLAKDFKIHIAESLSVPDINIFINGTPIGLEKSEVYPINDNVLEKFNYVFDMVYGETELIQRAKKFKIQTINGFEMVLHQGFEQFKILTGENAPIEIMRAAIYND